MVLLRQILNHGLDFVASKNSCRYYLRKKTAKSLEWGKNAPYLCARD
jgi:hypothetical protein